MSEEQACNELHSTTTMSPSTSKPGSDASTKSPLRTILIFSAILAPLALAPYLLTRRQLLSLHTRLADLHALNARLARSLQAAHADLARRPDAATLREGLTELRAGLEAEVREVRQRVSAEVGREGKKLSALLAAARKVAEEREGARRAWEEELRRDIGVLLSENLVRRTRFAAELKELSRALADTAAFVEEVEMRQGWPPRPGDGRGIERTRRLAQRLQAFAATMEMQTPPPHERDMSEASESPSEGDSDRSRKD
ncbi:hypothetical protein FKP32DRAFT_1758315 [Trametes sanguinea]|nr:hypothetical protein FKP32DRAFT_1758315 [Trametes sanguinea]